MDRHQLILKGYWIGGLSGQGVIDAGNLKFIISAPDELGGIGKGTNPEEMMIGAAASCYLITLGAVLERRRKKIERISMTSEATVSHSGGRFKLESIIHRPVLVTSSDITTDEKEEIIHLAQRADQYCMISNAIRGNVDLRIEPIIAEL